MSADSRDVRTIAGAQLERASLTEIATIAEAAAAVDSGAGAALLCRGAGESLGAVTDAALREALLRGLTAGDPASRLDLEPVEILTDPASSPRGAFGIVREGAVVTRFLVRMDATPAPRFALVLAGGLGTRMAPLTDSIPKPLVPVAGRPLLEHVLRHLTENGISDVTIATNHLAERIEAFVGSGDRFGLRVRFVRETQRMGTAGAIGMLDPVPQAPFFVVNADVLTKLDLSSMARKQTSTGASLVMAIAPHVVESPYGVVRLVGTRVVDLTEKPRTLHWVNAGIYLLDPRVAAAVPRNVYVDMTTMIDKWIHRGEHVEAVPIREYWRDAGTPEDVARADRELR